MSKKSRKRNKKILAAIGLGLGAAAMASKRKADLASTEDGKSAPAKSIPTGPKELGISTRKKKSTSIAPRAVNVATPPKRSNASTAGDFINKINDKKSAESGMQFSNSLVNSKLPTRKRVSLEQGMSNIDTTPIKQYKSGGRVKKSMGKALRGGGKVMR